MSIAAIGELSRPALAGYIINEFIEHLLFLLSYHIKEASASTSWLAILSKSLLNIFPI